MPTKKCLLAFALGFSGLGILPAAAWAQANSSGGTLRGAVTLGEGGKPIHNVRVTIIQLKRAVGTDENGKYEFQNVPPGKYDVTAHLELAPDVVQTVHSRVFQARSASACRW